MSDHELNNTTPKVYAHAKLPTMHGEFALLAFDTEIVTDQSFAIAYGDWTNMRNGLPVLTRLHSECVTGDALGSLRCDCGDQLQLSMMELAKTQCGLILYLRQEGRGIGIVNKIRAYEMQDQGIDTVDANTKQGLPADGRSYRIAAKMLEIIGVVRVRLMTNNPSKCEALARYGVEVVERIPIHGSFNKHNRSYLETKKQRMGHFL